MYHFDEAINKSDRKPRLEKYNQSDLIYDTNHSFYKYHDIKKFDNLSFRSKCSLLLFFNDLNKSNKLKIQIEQAKEKKQICMIQFQNYIITCWKHLVMNTIIYEMQKEVKSTPNMILLTKHLMKYGYFEWYKETSVDEKELDDLPSLEGDEEEVKEEKWLRILTRNKLLSRLSILLARVKTGND